MKKSRLIDQLRSALRVRHYSIRTEQAYVEWLECFILFHHKRHPRYMSEKEITAFFSHLMDLEQGHGSVQLRFALASKYPGADTEWGWQFVFPSQNRRVDPISGRVRRHHVHESNIPRALKPAARNIGLNQPITSHALRHSFATHLLARISHQDPGCWRRTRAAAPPAARGQAPRLERDP